MLVAFAAICWGVVGIWSRQLTATGLTYPEMVAIRGAATAIFLFIFLFITDRNQMKVKIKDLGVFICMGGLGVAAGMMCYFHTMEKTTLSTASILLYTSPYMVMLMSAIIFKEKITLQKFGALLIAFSGCVMTIGLVEHANLPLSGVITGLTAAFFYSTYTIFGKIAMRKYSPLTTSAYTYGIALLIFLPFCDPVKMVTIACADSANLVNILCFGVLCTLLPVVCYMTGLKRLEPSRVAIIAFLEPLTAAIAGVMVYNELLSVMKIAGIAMIFAALIILNWRTSR